MKNKTTIILSIFIILTLAMQFILPITANAYELQKVTREESTIDVNLKRNESNSNIVNITATDTTYDIIELKYVHKYIEISNIEYFEQNNSDVHTFEIIPSRSIQESFELEGYGSYTVYAKNSRGDRFLSRITINDPEDAPDITLIKNEENPMHFTIQVTSKNNTITTLKIAKKQNIDDKIDFNTQGTDIEFIESNNVNVKYDKITEEGLYEVYAADNKGNKTSVEIYLSKSNTPIEASIWKGSAIREVELKIKDSLCDIVKVKVARNSEISGFEDFNTKGEELQFTKGNNVTINYIAPEDDTYVFYIEDEAGFKKMLTKRITENEKAMNIDIKQDEANPKNVKIKAINEVCKIVKLKVAIGENIDLKYFKQNGEEIEIVAGKEVNVEYTVNKDCKLNVYVEDEEGYTYMYSKNLTGIDEPQPITPPTIEVSQNSDNPKQIDVTVKSTDSYIRKIKWAKDSRDEKYFENNGTQIGIGNVGKIIKTDFVISSIGVYTIYAEDNEGNKTVKEINITNIDDKPIPDTKPPEITGVENNKIYNKSLTPKITDENLAEVILKKDDNVVENYKNGDTIEEDGIYQLIATDKAGNETEIKFGIDRTAPEINIEQEIKDEKNVTANIKIIDNLVKIKKAKIAKGEKDIEYFAENGQELEVKGENTTASIAINITDNGIYTVYAEDILGNKSIEKFEVTTIKVDTEPEPEDKIPPKITGVQDGKTYTEKISPKAEDENLVEVILRRNGEIVKKYKNGDVINKNGQYTLTAKDKAGNTSSIRFTINIKDTNNNTNSNTNTGNNNTNTNNNTNNNTNTNGDTNTGNNNVNTNSNVNSENNNSNTNITNSSDNKISNNKENNLQFRNKNESKNMLPYAGNTRFFIIGIIVAMIVAIFSYFKYKKYNKIK